MGFKENATIAVVLPDWQKIFISKTTAEQFLDKGVQWVVQRNLADSSAFLASQDACKNIEVDFMNGNIVPFSNDLLFFDRRRRAMPNPAGMTVVACFRRNGSELSMPELLSVVKEQGFANVETDIILLKVFA